MILQLFLYSFQYILYDSNYSWLSLMPQIKKKKKKCGTNSNCLSPTSPVTFNMTNSSIATKINCKWKIVNIVSDILHLDFSPTENK